MQRRSIPSLAALGAIISPLHGRLRSGLSEFGPVSRADMNNPPGSTDPELRKARNDRRVRKMRLRKLRGWH